MPGGSAIRYQGLPLVSMILTLSRGWQANLCTVELWAQGWSTGRNVWQSEITPGEQAGGRATVPRDSVTVQIPQVGEDPPSAPPGSDLAECLRVARAGASDTELGPPPRVHSIPWAGWLTWAEVEGGMEFTGTAGPYYLTDVVEVKRSGDGSLVSLLRLTLADARWRSMEGALRRWSFNRRSARAALVPDSLRPDGTPWTAAQVLQELAVCRRGAPVLQRIPARLEVEAGPREFPRFALASRALADEVQRLGLEDPCPTWHGNLALFYPGEQALSTTPDSGDPPGKLPRNLRLWASGAGEGDEAELGYPADYVLVVGGERIATAAVDEWEPLLDLSGAPLPEAVLAKLFGGSADPNAAANEGLVIRTYVPLSEETVRALTEGKYGLEWLRKWILGDHSHVGAGIARGVAELLSAQAWRLYGLPGVVTATGEPGRNAHLVPILPRAETDGERRLPVQVEAFAFQPVHAAYKDEDEGTLLLINAGRELGRLRDEIRAAAASQAKRDPFGPQVYGDLLVPLTTQRPLSPTVVRNLLAPLGAEGFSDEALAQAVEQARTLQRIQDAAPGLAGAYESALTVWLEQQGGGGALLLKAGKLVAQLEEQLRQGSGAFDINRLGTLVDRLDVPIEQRAVAAQVDLDQQLATLPQLRAFVESIKAVGIEARQQREAKDRRTAAGATGTAPKPVMVWIHENLDRQADRGAVVYDEQRGVVLLSHLGGHLADTDVAPDALLDTLFVPRPVRVLFGCVVRPRRDLLPGAVGRPVTGARAAGALEDVIPTALGDEATYFLRAYTRGGGGVPQPVPFMQASDESRDAIRQRAQVVEAPWLVELVPLGGVRPENELVLDRAAFEAAQGPMQRRDLIRGGHRTFARPWRVQLDGVVASVKIMSRPQMAGFVTEVHVGSSERALDPYTTRVRPTVGGGGAARAADTRRRDGTEA